MISERQIQWQHTGLAKKEYLRNRCTSTSHDTETSDTDETMARWIKEGSSPILFESDFVKWRTDSTECCRDLQSPRLHSLWCHILWSSTCESIIGPVFFFSFVVMIEISLFFQWSVSAPLFWEHFTQRASNMCCSEGRVKFWKTFNSNADTEKFAIFYVPETTILYEEVDKWWTCYTH